MYSLILLILTYHTHALPARPNDISTLSNGTGWSKEAILALVGVLVAIILFGVGLASKTIRRWIVDNLSRTYQILVTVFGIGDSFCQLTSVGALRSMTKDLTLRRICCGHVQESGWSLTNGEVMWKVGQLIEA